MRTRVKHKVVAAAVVASALLVIPASAEATCQPGKVGIENGRPVVRLPQCDPYPQ